MRAKVLFCDGSNQELPEQAYLHPPLTIFVLEQRAFGRLALVGSHVVQSLMDYAPAETGLQPEEEDDEPKRRKTNGKSAEKEMMPSSRSYSIHRCLNNLYSFNCLNDLCPIHVFI